MESGDWWEQLQGTLQCRHKSAAYPARTYPRKVGYQEFDEGRVQTRFPIAGSSKTLLGFKRTARRKGTRRVGRQVGQEWIPSRALTGLVERTDDW